MVFFFWKKLLGSAWFSILEIGNIPTQTELHIYHIIIHIQPSSTQYTLTYWNLIPFHFISLTLSAATCKEERPLPSPPPPPQTSPSPLNHRTRRPPLQALLFAPLSPLTMPLPPSRHHRSIRRRSHATATLPSLPHPTTLMLRPHTCRFVTHNPYPFRCTTSHRWQSSSFHHIAHRHRVTSRESSPIALILPPHRMLPLNHWVANDSTYFCNSQLVPFCFFSFLLLKIWNFDLYEFFDVLIYKLVGFLACCCLDWLKIN